MKQRLIEAGQTASPIAEMPGAEDLGGHGGRLDQARAQDAAWRRERVAGVQRWIDAAAHIARSGPALLFLAALPPLAVVLGVGITILCCRVFGADHPKWLLPWVELVPHLQRGLMIAGAVAVLSARWLSRRLLRQARSEGLEVCDPTKPPSAESEV